ncbi:MAG: TerD family protein [Bacteroidales bacterium]|nr:TerD family protein [Bacteroidales bacterium]
MVNLVKGQNQVINMNVFHIGLGWDVNEGASPYPFDLDVSAFMLNKNKKTPSDDYLVFYNSEKRLRVYLDGPNKGELVKPLQITPYTYWSSNDAMREQSRPVDPELSVIGSIDDEDGATSEDGDDETMDIDLSKVREDIQEIIISVSIFDYAIRKQNFGQVERAYVRLYKPGQEAEGQGEFIYDLTEDFSTCSSVEFCRLYKHNGEWKVQATGIGHRGGLEELVDKYM